MYEFGFSQFVRKGSFIFLNCKCFGDRLSICLWRSRRGGFFLNWNFESAGALFAFIFLPCGIKRIIASIANAGWSFNHVMILIGVFAAAGFSTFASPQKLQKGEAAHSLSQKSNSFAKPAKLGCALDSTWILTLTSLIFLTPR